MKHFAVLAVFVFVAVLFVSCSVESEFLAQDEVTFAPIASVTPPVAPVAPPTEVMPSAEPNEQIVGEGNDIISRPFWNGELLFNENNPDAKGLIYLGMSLYDVIEQLENTFGITISETIEPEMGRCLNLGDTWITNNGYEIYFNFAGKIYGFQNIDVAVGGDGTIYAFKTAKGLSLGNSFEDMAETYGINYQFYHTAEDDSNGCYEYQINNFYLSFWVADDLIFEWGISEFPVDAYYHPENYGITRPDFSE